MKLSVIIPAYNVEQYVSECLDSILLSEKDIEAPINTVVQGDYKGEKVFIANSNVMIGDKTISAKPEMRISKSLLLIIYIGEGLYLPTHIMGRWNIWIVLAPLMIESPSLGIT